LKDEPRTPPGFQLIRSQQGFLIVHERLRDAFTEGGFTDAAAWLARLSSTPGQSGRGASAVVQLGGASLRIKQLRRGGLAAGVHGERFHDRRRLLDNLELPLVVGERGIPTAAPRALLIESTLGAGFRGWLATEELSGMYDAADLVRRDPQRADRRWLPAMSLVRRMHDAGIEHRDLNLGNLMIADEAERQPAIVDFDRARLHAGPLSFRLRQKALRRLERSYVKIRHPLAADEATRTQIYARYAAEDLELTRRLRRGRVWGRRLIALHRLGW
jgi:3-deoxy-D-manno-octulosonic acid kinase